MTKKCHHCGLPSDVRLEWGLDGENIGCPLCEAVALLRRVQKDPWCQESLRKDIDKYLEDVT